MCYVKKCRGWRGGENEKEDKGMKARVSKWKTSVLFLQGSLSPVSLFPDVIVIYVGSKSALSFVNQMLLISVAFIYIRVDCGFSLTDFFFLIFFFNLNSLIKSHCTAEANGRSWKTVGEKTLLEAAVHSKTNVNVEGDPVQQAEIHLYNVR